MNKSEQQMWDAIKSHYEKYPEKWTVVKDESSYAFMSTGVKVIFKKVRNGYLVGRSVSCMGVFGGDEQIQYWEEEVTKWENRQYEESALSVIKALEENS